MVVGDGITMADVSSRLASKHDAKCSGILGPEGKDSDKVVFLNRVLRDHGLDRYSAKGVDVPSSNKSVEDALKELELPILDPARARAYRP
eukprot:7329837-Pyramimonas_sp.AAC.1